MHLFCRYRFVTIATVLLIAFIGFVSIGCERDALSARLHRTRDKDTKIEVIATVGMVADLVRNVGGDHVNVSQLMGAGIDPHLYQATRDDVAIIMSGDMVFYSGLMLEGRMTYVLDKLSERSPVIAITEKLAPESLLSPDGFEGHFDPHVWMDVSAWSRCVTKIEEALSEYDPDHADYFRAQATAYRERLDKLHAYGVESFKSIPQDRRVLLTSHDAFNYLGRAYGVEVLGVQGLSTESEAGLQQINALVDLLVSRKVSAVFVESSVSQKNIMALIDGARSRGHNVRVGGELYSDAMGPVGTYEGTYEGMLDHNITLITRALGGTAPSMGLNGKLSPPHDEP